MISRICLTTVGLCLRKEDRIPSGPGAVEVLMLRTARSMSSRAKGLSRGEGVISIPLRRVLSMHALRSLLVLVLELLLLLEVTGEGSLQLGIGLLDITAE
jgi:hypothetical protein